LDYGQGPKTIAALAWFFGFPARLAESGGCATRFAQTSALPRVRIRPRFSATPKAAKPCRVNDEGLPPFPFVHRSTQDDVQVLGYVKAITNHYNSGVLKNPNTLLSQGLPPLPVGASNHTGILGENPSAPSQSTMGKGVRGWRDWGTTLNSTGYYL